MMQIRLNIHGLPVLIRVFDESLAMTLDWLSEDFRYFLSPREFSLESTHLSPKPLLLEIRSIRELDQTKQNRWKKKFPLFQTKMCRAFGFWRRQCQYNETHWLEIESKDRTTLYGDDLHQVYEISYIYLVSRISEELEKKGWFRIHAFGYENPDESAATVIALPSGGGKSVLATQALKKNLAIYSDEMIWVKDFQAHPFPLRIGILPQAAEHLSLPDARVFQRKNFDHKLLYPIPSQNIARPQSIKHFYSGHQGGLFGLFFVIVLGLGLPQMREFLLRGSNVFWIPRLFLQRVAFAFTLLSRQSAQNVQLDHSHFNNFDKIQSN